MNHILQWDVIMAFTDGGRVCIGDPVFSYVDDYSTVIE
jgi:hypothetical protein